MRKIKLTLEYDGTDFYGWQVQAKTGERTVQGVLEAALTDVPGAVPRVMAAGRTDAGVHALAMTAHYLTDDTIPVARTAAALNARLPGDVRVLNAEAASPDFEAQFGCRYPPLRIPFALSERPVRVGRVGLGPSPRSLFASTPRRAGGAGSCPALRGYPRLRGAGDARNAAHGPYGVFVPLGGSRGRADAARRR